MLLQPSPGTGIMPSPTRQDTRASPQGQRPHLMQLMSADRPICNLWTRDIAGGPINSRPGAPRLPRPRPFLPLVSCRLLPCTDSFLPAPPNCGYRLGLPDLSPFHRPDLSFSLSRLPPPATVGLELLEAPDCCSLDGKKAADSILGRTTTPGVN